MNETTTRRKSIQANVRELGKARNKQARLVITIPSLMFLVTILVTAVIRIYMVNIAVDIQDEATAAEVSDLADTALYVGVIGSVVVFVAGLLLANEIVRPVRNILATIRKVSEGDFTQRAETSSLGEISTLGTAFNDMVEQLHLIFTQRDKQMREAAVGSVLTIDGYGKILAADYSFFEIFGKDADQVFGHNLLGIVDQIYEDESAQDFRGLLNEAINNSHNNISTLESIEVVRKGESNSMQLSVKVMPLDSTNLEAPTAIIDVRDMSSLQGFLETIQRADRLAAVGSLATGIAHEIRNPLGSIKGMTQLIEEDLADNEENSNHIDYLKRIRKESDRLDKLVSSIMDFARTEPGAATKIHLNDTLKELYETALAKMEYGPDELPNVEWDLAELPAIPLEENRIRQAYLNLIINALEEISEQTNGKLIFRSYLDKSYRKRQLCFEIANTGNALPKEIKERIFEPFFTTKPEGTGLGLPIAYQIIVANNGNMEFEFRDNMVRLITRFPHGGVEEENMESSRSYIEKIES